MRNSMYNILKLPVPIVDGIFGVEIEAEGTKLPHLADANWHSVADGSLVSGYQALEYVMPAPTNLAGVRKALDYLDKMYKLNAAKIIETETSGVHVHVNVQEYSPKELFTLIVVYLLLEELLITYCGPWREGNHFCLRIKDAEFILHAYIKAATKRQFGGLKGDDIRYASLNPCSLFKYGSLEFRAMRGTGNLDAIYEWVEILDRVRLGAKKYKLPADVLYSISHDGEASFIREILGDKAKLFNGVDGVGMVRDAVKLIQPLAFIPDYSLFKEEKNNPFA